MLDLRVEFLHSAAAHFPIALTYICLIAKVIEITTTKFAPELSKQFEIICRYLLFTLPLFVMVTIFIGDEALEAVKNSACDLVSITRHGEQGENALIVLIIAVLFQAGILFHRTTKTYKTILNFLLLITLFINGWVIGSAAHDGGKLVFDQGVAVKVGQKDCSLRNNKRK